MSENKKFNILEKIKLLKSDKVKNQALFKRGGFAIGITALVLAVIIALNLLVAVLAKRVTLEYDISPDKSNSISEDNEKFIKAVKKDVTVTVCASEENYLTYMSYLAQNNNVSASSDYYSQTLKIVEKYGNINDKISINFVDPQTSEFLQISQNYSDLHPTVGDIIVSCKVNGNDRHKLITFNDIYTLSDPSGYAAMGYGQYSISENKIETALTSAVAFVTSDKTKNAFFIKGHSNDDHSAPYIELLKANNYEITENSEKIVNSIDSKADIAVIMAPVNDFTETEISALSDFLYNDGKLGKGLIYFGNAKCPALPNLYDFLSEWGIVIEDGIIFETDSNYCLPEDPSVVALFPGEDEITKNMNYFITGNNIAMSVGEASEKGITATEIVKTTDSAAKVPVGSAADYKPGEDEIGAYSPVIMAEKSDYNDNNEKISSYVFALSSTDFADSDYAETSVPDKDLCLALADKGANVGDTGISFISKTISEESFAESVTAAKSNAIIIIFAILLPLLLIVAGIVIFVRRRNA